MVLNIAIEIRIRMLLKSLKNIDIILNYIYGFVKEINKII